jgi:hypothetical protein
MTNFRIAGDSTTTAFAVVRLRPNPLPGYAHLSLVSIANEFALEMGWEAETNLDSRPGGQDPAESRGGPAQRQRAAIRNKLVSLQFTEPGLFSNLWSLTSRRYYLSLCLAVKCLRMIPIHAICFQGHSR